MRQSISREFGTQKPRAIVLDDNVHARQMTARRLRSRGFEVEECADANQFTLTWLPGTVDVIVSDWDLSSNEDENGDKVLEWVRERDWDVPFVLVSGKLAEAEERAPILQSLLENGSAGFVSRGASGIKEACNLAEGLIERRDLALLKMVLALRPGALEGMVVPTSSGQVSVAEKLAELVKRPASSHEASRPVAQARSRRATNPS